MEKRWRAQSRLARRAFAFVRRVFAAQFRSRRNCTRIQPVTVLDTHKRVHTHTHTYTHAYIYTRKRRTHARTHIHRNVRIHGNDTRAARAVDHRSSQLPERFGEDFAPIKYK